MKQILLILITAGSVFSARSHDPWVFRGVMSEKPRMVFIALHDDLTVVYETQNCGLYVAWAGGVQDGNETYTHQRYGNKGATFYPQGNILHMQREEAQISEVPLTADTDRGGSGNKSFSPAAVPPVDVWSATVNGLDVEIKVDYRGHTLNNSDQTVVLRYRITMPDGSVIDVRESPEYTSSGGNTGLIRAFSVSGISHGVEVSLKLSGSSIQKSGGGSVQEDWTKDGAGQINQSGGNTYFVLGTDGQATITGIWR